MAGTAASEESCPILRVPAEIWVLICHYIRGPGPVCGPDVLDIGSLARFARTRKKFAPIARSVLYQDLDGYWSTENLHRWDESARRSNGRVPRSLYILRSILRNGVGELVRSIDIGRILEPEESGSRRFWAREGGVIVWNNAVFAKVRRLRTDGAFDQPLGGAPLAEMSALWPGPFPSDRRIPPDMMLIAFLAALPNLEKCRMVFDWMDPGRVYTVPLNHGEESHDSTAVPEGGYPPAFPRLRELELTVPQHSKLALHSDTLEYLLGNSPNLCSLRLGSYRLPRGLDFSRLAPGLTSLSILTAFRMDRVVFSRLLQCQGLQELELSRGICSLDEVLSPVSPLASTLKSLRLVCDDIKIPNYPDDKIGHLLADLADLKCTALKSFSVCGTVERATWCINEFGGVERAWYEEKELVWIGSHQVITTWRPPRFPPWRLGPSVRSPI
ncbi:hypothetical protein V8F33_006073 [Rhypophila sp. PSN 637]